MQECIYECVQLKRAKALCAKRMLFVGGSEYSCYTDSNEVPLDKKVYTPLAALYMSIYLLNSHNSLSLKCLPHMFVENV